MCVRIAASRAEPCRPRGGALAAAALLALALAGCASKPKRPLPPVEPEPVERPTPPPVQRPTPPPKPPVATPPPPARNFGQE